MGIRPRMFLGVFAALFFLLTSNLIAQYVFDQSSQTINRIVNETQVKVALLNELKRLTDERAVLARDLVITEEADFLERANQRLKSSANDIAEVFEQLDAMALDAKEQAYYEAIRENVVAANRSFGSFKMMADEQFYQAAVEILIGEFGDKYQSFTDIVQQFLDYEQAQNAQAVQALREQESFAVVTLWSVLVVSVVLFSMAGFMVARSFMKPIDAMRHAMQEIIRTGQLNQRVTVFSKDELGQTSEAINQLLATVHHAIDDVNEVMHGVAQGQFGREISHDYQGDFALLKTGVNQSVRQVHSMIEVLNQTAHHLRNGRFQMPTSETVEFSGEYASVIKDLSVAMQRLDNSMQDIGHTLHALARGDFSRRVTADARGELVRLKEAINQTLEGLESFVEEVAKVQTSISEGDLTHWVQEIGRAHV